MEVRILLAKRCFTRLTVKYPQGTVLPWLMRRTTVGLGLRAAPNGSVDMGIGVLVDLQAHFPAPFEVRKVAALGGGKCRRLFYSFYVSVEKGDGDG
jgi:hypothetical protein